jgi:biotin carboxylase
MPEVTRLVEAAIRLVGYHTGGINVEAFRDESDNLWLMEIGPRSGGNFIPQLMQYATGFDLVKANVDALFHEPVPELSVIAEKGIFAQVILHSGTGGRFAGLNIPHGFREKVVEAFIRTREGDLIEPYRNSGQVIGALILRLDHRDEAELLRQCLYQHDWINTR